MLQKAYRFRGKSSVAVMYKTSKMVRTPSAHLRFRSKKAATARTAVVVSKKTAKSAVVRNRIRRRVYEWVRLHGENQYDKIYTIYDETFARIAWEQLSKELEKLYSQAQNKQAKDDIIKVTNRSAIQESEK